MIFDGRPVDQITDAEFNALVADHVAERKHLEFKVTINHREDGERLELLLDIASLANAGGGYLLVGIRDDGRGKAQRFEPPGDTARLARSIRDLCHEHIAERIDGLEVVERVIGGNPLVIVRVPVSARVPHMVTFNQGTYFWLRYEDGKRAMTLAEIRECFTEDLLNRRLSAIQRSIQQLSRVAADERRQELRSMIEAGDLLARLQAESGSELSRANAEAVARAVGDRPTFYISITPESLRPGSVDVDREEVRAAFGRGPGWRHGGWIVTNEYAEIESFGEGIRYRRHGLQAGQLELLTNGHMTYAIHLEETFYHKQSPEEIRRRPRLWPYAIIEYPLSFFRLYRAICELSHLPGAFEAYVQYLNIKGHILPAGPPTPFGFLGGRQPDPFPNQSLGFRMECQTGFQPDLVTFNLVRQVYAAFGYEVRHIPFWNAGVSRFELPG